MKTMTRLNFSLFALGLVFSSVSCTYLAEQVLEKPKVSLDKVSLRDANASGATVVFGVAVDNPNPFAIRVDSLKYDVEIGGKPLSSGRLNGAAEVRGRERSVVEIPIPVKYTEVFSSVLDLVSKKSSTYRVKGEAAFGLLTVPFDKTGDLKLKP